MRGAPTLYERARNTRLKKGMSLSYSAERYGVSVTYLGYLERGLIDDRDRERAYLQWLEGRRARTDRTRGGEQKVGRVKRRLKSPSQYRGKSLLPDFDHQAALPPQWTILALSRVSETSELAAIYDFTNERYGLVSFYLDENIGPRIGTVIPFDAEYDKQSTDFLEAFADGYYPDEYPEIEAPSEATLARVKAEEPKATIDSAQLEGPDAATPTTTLT